jgi:hypothetical protein
MRSRRPIWLASISLSLRTEPMLISVIMDIRDLTQEKSSISFRTKREAEDLSHTVEEWMKIDSTVRVVGGLTSTIEGQEEGIAAEASMIANSKAIDTPETTRFIIHPEGEAAIIRGRDLTSMRDRRNRNLEEAMGIVIGAGAASEEEAKISEEIESFSIEEEAVQQTITRTEISSKETRESKGMSNSSLASDTKDLI